MRGTAELEPFDEDRANRIFEGYLGANREAWDPKFTGPWEPDRWRLIRFVPETVVARDQSYAGSLTPT